MKRRNQRREANTVPVVKGKKAKPVTKPAKASSGKGAKTDSKTSSDTKTATATKTSTSTDAYTQGNITVTGGAGKGATSVTIALPGGSLKNNAKKPGKAKAKEKEESYNRG